MDKIMQSSRTCKTVIDGEESEYTVFFRNKYPTNGGYMCDISVSHDNVETRHRVIIGEVTARHSTSGGTAGEGQTLVFGALTGVA